MPLKDNMNNFDYNNALSDLGITQRDHLWERLKTTARAQTDLERAQMVHDVSWILTQIENKDRNYLQMTRNEVMRVVSDAYGPRIWAMLAGAGFTVESFIAPIAKLLRGDSHDPLLQLMSFADSDVRRPTSEFAATFTKLWLYNQIINHIPTKQIQPSERGTRVLIGRAKTCPDCNGQGLLESKIHECIQHLREKPEGTIGKTFADFVRALRPDGSVSGDILINFFGEEIICPNCRWWMDVPKQAQNDWVCPVVDGNNNRIFWLRLEIV